MVQKVLRCPQVVNYLGARLTTHGDIAPSLLCDICAQMVVITARLNFTHPGLIPISKAMLLKATV